MKVDAVKLVVGSVIGGVIYKIGKRKGFNEHADKCKDVLLDALVREKEEES